MPETTAPAPETSSSAAQPRANGIDVAQLADKVYRLMLADARLSLARGQQSPQHASRSSARYE
jgi:hypothetical protein